MFLGPMARQWYVAALCRGTRGQRIRESGFGGEATHTSSRMLPTFRPVDLCHMSSRYARIRIGLVSTGCPDCPPGPVSL